MTNSTETERLNAVVAKAYAAIANPEAFVPLLSELVDTDEELGGIGTVADMHFENAFSIFEKMYPFDAADFSSLTTRYNTDIACDLALDRSMRALIVNDRLLSGDDLAEGRIIPQWMFDPVNENVDREALRLAASGQPGVARLFLRLYTSPEDQNGRWFRAWPTEIGGDTGVALHAVRLRWSDRSGEAFQQALGLTGTEIALVRHLVMGGSVREFSELRGRSVGTARNQMKALQKKLAINSKEDLLLLYAGFVHSLDPPGEDGEGLHYRCGNIFAEPGGGSIAWEEYGDRSGLPVLFCHALEGPLMPHATDEAAKAAGLRIIAPWRPHYGDTSGTALGAASPREFARRMPAFLDHLQVDRVALVGTQAGMPFLAAMACECADRIVAAIGAGPFLPIVRNSDYEYLPKRQRIHFRISRIAPVFARVYMRAMLASMGTGEFYRFVEDYYDSCPRELRVVQDPEMIRIFRRAAAYVLASGPQGPIDTMLNWSANWSDLISEAGVELDLLVGEQDANTTPEFARRTAERHGLKLPEIVPDAGSFLMVERPDMVMAHIRERFEASDQT